MVIIREKVHAHVVNCVETYEGAERLAQRHANVQGATTYVDMASALCNTPWVVWSDTLTPNTRYRMQVSDLDTQRETVCLPTKKK